MFRLTTQQQLVLIVALLLLLVGWAVKALRLAHPNEQKRETIQQTE